MIEWYLDKETNSLTRLCNNETEHAEMKATIGLNTQLGAYLYHNWDFGIDYRTIYEDSYELAKLNLTEQIKRTLTDLNVTDVTFVKTGNLVTVTVEIETQDGVVSLTSNLTGLI